MKKLWLFTLSTIIGSGLSGCYKEKTTPPGDCNIVVSYSLDIQPIINSSCITNLGPGTGCHDSWILTYSSLAGKMADGTVELECLIERTMPVIPNNFGIDSLTADERKSIRCWLEQGYPEN